MKKPLLLSLILTLIIILLVIILFKYLFPQISSPNSDNSKNLSETVTPITTNNIKRIFSMKGEEFQILQPYNLNKISSPLVIEGEVKGPWFFEGTFPIKIEDKGGNLIKQGVAQSSEDWMSTGWVSFRTSIDFDIEKEIDAIIIFKKSNPSDLPENEDQATINVKLFPN